MKTSKEPLIPLPADVLALGGSLALGGALMGLMAPLFHNLFNKGRPMTKLEKTALALVGALCETIEKMDKELSERPTKVMLEDALKRAERAEARARELENQQPQLLRRRRK